MADPIDLGTLDVYRGDYWSYPINEVTDNGDGTTTPIDLIAKYGPTWVCQARTSEDADPPVSVAVDTSNASSQGQVVLSIADTTQLGNPGGYVGDVQVTGGGVSPQTPYRFRLRVVKDVTRP